MGALREVFATFGLEFDHKGVKEAHKETESLKEGIEGVVAIFAGSELLRGVSEFAEKLESLSVVSETTHLPVEEVQLYDFAAQKAGGSTEEMNQSLTMLQRALGHTAQGAAEAGPQMKALAALHVDTAHGALTLADALPQIVEGFGGLKTEAQQAEVATALFGRSGVRMLPILRQGKEGLAKLSEEMGEFGGPVSEQSIAAGREYADSLKLLDHAWFTLKGNLGSAVFPALTKGVEWIGKTVAKLGAWTSGTTLANTATYALAGTIAVKLGTALAPYLKAGLKFAAIFLAVDDVIGFLQGKDSLIGRLLDKAFGSGTADAVRAWVNDAIGAFSELSNSGVSIFHALGQAWGDTLNDMFTAFDTFVLGAENKWNDLVGALHLPDSFKIDTGDAENRVKGDKAVHAAYERTAYEDMHPEDVAKTIHGGSGEELAYGTRSKPFNKADVRAAFGPTPAAAKPGAPTAAKPGAPADFAAEFGIGTGHREGTPKPAAVAAPAPNYAAAFTAPPTVALANAGFAGNPLGAAAAPVVNVDARTTVIVQGDASDAVARDAARKISRTQADGHRKAAQSLVARKAAS